MQRYFIYLAYDGTAYHGWQVQPNGLSVQEVLTKALSTLLRVPTEITGAGRTDAGVHARQMVAHFDAAEPLECSRLTYKLNRMLPPDISVYKVVPVRSDAHARFDATQRTYHYFVRTEKSPFERFYSFRIHGTPDFRKMNEAAELLLQYEDFTSFSKLHTHVKSNLCHVSQARWEQVGPQLWRFEISANRFLRNMVRAIVGTLLEVGRGQLSIEGFRAVIEGRNRCCAGESVAANALFLVGIKYEEHIFTDTSEPPHSPSHPNTSNKTLPA